MLKENRTDLISWRKPQIWTHKGYRAYMYQSENEYGNWRILHLYRADGTKVTDKDVPGLLIKSNISASVKNTQQYLREQIAWDLMTDEEKQSRIKEFERQSGFLW